MAATARPAVDQILAALRALAEETGAVVEEKRGSDCFTGLCVYSTPSRHNFYDPESQTWKSEGPVLDTTTVTFRWAPTGRFGEIFTGPTSCEVLARLGLYTLNHTPDRAREGLVRVRVYVHDALVDCNGSRGEGLTLVTMAAKRPWANEDERDLPKIGTNADGGLRTVWFG